MTIKKENLAKIKKALENKRDQIEEDLKKIAAEDKRGNEMRAKFPEYGNKADENAQEISEYSTNLATEKVLESELRDIKSALKRIKDKTYGICKYCGEKINEKRLLARPVASSCVKCKERIQKEK